MAAATAALLSVHAVVGSKPKPKTPPKTTTQRPWHPEEKRKPQVVSVSVKEGKKEESTRWAGAMGEVGRVLRHDGEFLRAATAPLRKTLDDIFWLRFLERPGPGPGPTQSNSSAVFDTISISPYPPGLNSVDLIMADIEALKLYLKLWQQSMAVWFIPMPEQYDPQQVAYYFSTRPHVLAFRIAEILFSFAFAAIKLQATRRLKLSRRDASEDGSLKSSIGYLLKGIFLDLGPTFVKVGQSLSTRPDLIGPEICEALAQLHDKVPPFSSDVAMKIIEEEFGYPLDNIFRHISDEPVAAASFGQVYQGCTVDGTVVAIKVQRPNLLPSVLRDIYILRLGLAFLRKVTKRRSDPSLYADELGKGFVGELDYRVEAANASKFLEAHSEYQFMMVPKVFEQLTRKRVLTMEWMIGENPIELLSLSKGFSNNGTQCSEKQKLDAKARLLDLVSKGVEASLVQLIETGLLHADPHPGNLRYTPDGRIGFLDFGLLCSMEQRHQLAMLASIIHIVNGDWGALVYDLTEMDVIPRGTNLRQVTLKFEEALGEVTFNNGIPDIKFSKVLGKIWSVALKFHFRMPPYYTLVLRSLASLEGLAVAADQNFKTFQAAYPHVVRKLLYDNSLATRRILYSVIFDKRKELQWQKILLVLRLGSARKSMGVTKVLGYSKLSGYGEGAQESALQTANLVLRLLLSRDGVVIRRILMTADSKSLARDMVSKDAAVFRWLVSRALADVVYQWMVKVTGFKVAFKQELNMATGTREGEMAISSALSLPKLQLALRDRRLKIIFFKFIKDVRKDPIIMLRVSWNLFTIFVTSTLLGLHQYFVYLSEECLSFLPFVPQQLVPASS